MGTTLLEAKSGYGLSLADEVRSLEAIAEAAANHPVEVSPTFLGAHTAPDEYKDNRTAYVDLIVNEMLPLVAREGLARFCDVFCEKGAFDVDESRRILQAARACGMGLRVHADQLSLSGGSGLAAELGAITADHLEYAGQSEISALKSANVQPVLLPASVLMIGSRRYPEARAMIDAGKARSLAIMAPARAATFPDVPTLKESMGIDYKTGAWRGFAGPKGLPQPIATKLTAALKKIYDSKEYNDFMSSRGFGVVWNDAAGYAAFMDNADKQMGDAMKAAGIAKT